MVHILKEPRNALVKQYQTLLSYDDVELEFDDKALQEIAKKAIERKTGARGLRSIIEETMLDVMFEVPSQRKCENGSYHKEAVDGTDKPISRDSLEVTMEINTHNAEILLSAANKSHYPQDELPELPLQGVQMLANLALSTPCSIAKIWLVHLENLGKPITQLL